MPEIVMAWFFDTVVLSNFALSESIHLIEERYRGSGRITTEVLDETALGINCGHHSLNAISDIIHSGSCEEVSLSGDERRHYQSLLKTLGSGEASSIAAAASRNATVVTDDRTARRVCGELGIRFSGTVGILAACCRDKMISAGKADEYLETMISSGFYSPVHKISEIL